MSESQVEGSEEVSKPKKLSPAELKKQQQYIERCQRLINKGVDPKNVDNIIAQEDYESLPTEKKFKRLEKLVMNFSRSIISDVNALRYNDNLLSNVYDENLRASEKLFAILGITNEQFLTALAQAREESAAARAEEDKKRAETAAAEEQKVQTTVAAEADQSGEPPPPPAEASSFGS